MEDFEEQLMSKLKLLDETIWEGRAKGPFIKEWLSNFEEDKPGQPSERLHMLYLLRHFMYFGDRQIRELLKSLYRDLYKYPIIEKIRKSNNNTDDVNLINQEFLKELK